MNFRHIVYVNFGVAINVLVHHAARHFGISPSVSQGEAIVFGAIMGLAFAMDFESPTTSESD